MTQYDVEGICAFVLGRVFEGRSVDTSFTRGNSRFRVNMSHAIGGITMAMRMIPNTIPTAAEIDLPDAILKATFADKGIILITGPTGSGKSTTMATMLEYINNNTYRHIITLEDPVEFIYQNKKSLHPRRVQGK